MNILPQNTVLGTLDILHVYVHYDVPRLFSAVSPVGIKYIVYWIDTDDYSDSWLYAPISSKRCKALDNKEVKLRDIFIYPEDNLFKVKTYFEPKDSVVEVIEPSNLDDSMLPPSDFYIDLEKDGAQVKKEKSKSKHEISEVYIRSRKGKSQPPLSIVSKVTEAWSEVYSAILMSLEYSSGKGLIPIDARRGSFILRMESPKFTEAFPVIEKLFGILQSSESPYQDIVALGVNIEPIESLLSEITDGQVVFQLNKDEKYIANLNVTEARANEALTQMKDYESSYISSKKVPQANDINKVFKVIESRAEGRRIEPDTIGVSSLRQVAYYLHAARMLGYLSKSNVINSAGYQLSKMSFKRQMNATAIRFESSECGWSWLKWANASNICELDPDSAEGFLVKMCPTLSEDTAKRRAKTLRKWHLDLNKYRYIDDK